MIRILVPSILIIIWLLVSLKKPANGLIVLLFTLSIDFDKLFNIDIVFLIKILFLITSFWGMFKYGFKKQILKLYFLYGLFLFCAQIRAVYTSNYTIMTALQSSMLFLVGINLFCTNYRPTDYMNIKKVISILPYASIVFGIYSLYKFGFEGRFSAATTATNLSFLTCTSMVALISLYMESKANKYVILMLGSFAICCLTLTRGGMLFCAIVILPLTLRYLRTLTKEKILLIFAAVIGGGLLIVQVKNSLISRMFTSGGELNSSGRFVAWQYIIDLNKNGWFGQGYGKLAKLSLVGEYIDHFNAAHNEYVRFLYEGGMLGLAFIIVLFMIIFLRIKKGKTLPAPQFWAIILAFLMYSFVDNTMSNHVFWIPIMLLFNVLCGDKNMQIVKLAWRSRYA